jgi:hypothetical protein
VLASAVAGAGEDRLRLWLLSERIVLGPVLSERVLLLALDRGERGVLRGHAPCEGAIVVALLPEVGESLLVGFALLAVLLFLRGLGGGLVGLALALGERAPPVQLSDRLDSVRERPVLRGECPDLFKLLLQGGAQRGELVALRGEGRLWQAQVALPQAEQLGALGEVERLREQVGHGRREA